MKDHKELLRVRKLKATPGRLAALAFLRVHKRPASPQDIITGIGPRFDKSTAYRIVQDFLRAGIVRQVPSTQAGQNLFELTSLPHHHHFVCTVCGRIEDIGECDVEDMTKKALKGSKHFASVQGHSLDFFGMCKSCSAQSS